MWFSDLRIYLSIMHLNS